MGLNDVLYNRQSKSSSSNFLGVGSASVHAVEAFKNARQIFFCDANSIVFDGHVVVFFRILDGNLYECAIAFARLLNRVADQVENYLIHSFRIGAYETRLCGIVLSYHLNFCALKAI